MKGGMIVMEIWCAKIEGEEEGNRGPFGLELCG